MFTFWGGELHVGLHLPQMPVWVLAVRGVGPLCEELVPSVCTQRPGGLGMSIET